MGDGGVEIHEDPVVGQVLVERQDLGEVVVGRGAAAGPVEEVRRDGVEARIGEPLRDALDVVVDPERLLHDDDRPGRGLGRPSLEDVHRPVRRRDLDGPAS